MVASHAGGNVGRAGALARAAAAQAGALLAALSGCQPNFVEPRRGLMKSAISPKEAFSILDAFILKAACSILGSSAAAFWCLGEEEGQKGGRK